MRADFTNLFKCLHCPLYDLGVDGSVILNDVFNKVWEEKRAVI